MYTERSSWVHGPQKILWAQDDLFFPVSPLPKTYFTRGQWPQPLIPLHKEFLCHCQFSFILFLKIKA